MYKKTPYGFPSVITVFSAPNYLDAYQNKAAVIIYDQRLTVRQFTHQPHPYWLPNFMDAFTWTLPFVAQKVADMFHGLLSTISTDEMEEEEAREEDLRAEEIAARRMSIKQKIRDVGKMSRIFAVLREDSEQVSELKRIIAGTAEDEDPDHLLMQGLLELGAEGVRKAIKDFDDARRADYDNERLPHYEHSAIDNGADHHAAYGATFVSPSSRQRPVEHTLNRIRNAMGEERDFM